MKSINNLIVIGLIALPTACIFKNKDKSVDVTDPPPTEETNTPGPTKTPPQDSKDGGQILVPEMALVKDIHFADVDADGIDDGIAFTDEGVYVAINDGTGQLANKYQRWSTEFGQIDNDEFPRFLGDVNGDSKADIVFFGTQGSFVALAQADSFASPTQWGTSFGKESSDRAFSSQTFHPRFVGDLNGDGLSDIIGCHVAGCYASYSNGTSFSAPSLIIDDFSTDADGITSQEGWTSMNSYPRFMGDINGDKKIDMVGCGLRGLWASNSDGTRLLPKESTENPGPILAFFGTNQGWQSQRTHPRLSGDIDGDGLVDFVGLKDDEIFFALGRNQLASYSSLNLLDFQEIRRGLLNNGKLRLADITGDGKDELVVAFSNGAIVWTSLN